MRTKKSRTFRGDKVLYKSFLSGFISMASQIILLREFLLIFYGNELVTGIIISLWLALTALGALAGSKIRFSVSTGSLLLFQGLLILVLPVAVEFFRNIFFLPGIMLSPTQITGYSSVFLMFFCIPNGSVFALLNKELNGQNMSRRIYGWEAVGSLTGGIIVTLLSLPFLSFTNLNVATIVFWIYLFLLTPLITRKPVSFMRMFILLLLLVAGGTFLLFPVNNLLKRQLFFGQKVIASKDTPFGNITVTKESGQKNIYFNGTPLFTSASIKEREADVQYELLQRPDIKTVLLAGGGLRYAEQEILKYKSVKKIVHTELTDALFDPSFSNPKIKRTVTDVLTFLQKDTTRYDAIVLITPPPDNAVNNRYYTENFFFTAKKHLTPRGIIGFGLNASQNFLSEEELQTHSVLYNTLHQIFKHTLIVPGPKNYFLASEARLSLQYDSLYRKAGISNRYVNPDYIKQPELLFRHDQLMKQIRPTTVTNSFYRPVICFLSEKQWLNYFNIPFPLISGIAAFLFILFAAFLSPASAKMFGFGFSGASLEIVLLVAFQMIFGNLYLFTGILITLFMAGLGAGSLVKRALLKKSLSAFLWFALLCMLILGILRGPLPVKASHVTKLLFSLTLFIAGFITGNRYRFSISGQKKANPSAVYASDLAGALLGGFITSVWLIPVYGFTVTLLALPLLLFLTLAMAQIKEKISIL